MRIKGSVLAWGLTACGLGAFAADALAHARWALDGKLKPRDDSDAHKDPKGPCGGVAPNESRRTTLTAGEKITVTFEETVDHQGKFRIAFSKDGSTGFDANVLKDDIADPAGNTVPRKITQDITVPNEACDKCALQLIQEMGSSNYYSCADIKIVKGGATSGTGSGSTTTKPKAPQNLKVKVKTVGD